LGAGGAGAGMVDSAKVLDGWTRDGVDDGLSTPGLGVGVVVVNDGAGT